MAKQSTTKKSAAKKATTSKKSAPKKVAIKKESAASLKIKKQKQTSAKSVERLHDVIIDALQSKKAKHIVSLDLRKIDDAVANYFVICTGDVSTHIKAIADNVEAEVIKQLKEKPWHKEGFENLEWVIIDFVNIVVHVFKKDIRDFYTLEDLWADAEKKVFDND